MSSRFILQPTRCIRYGWFLLPFGLAYRSSIIIVCVGNMPVHDRNFSFGPVSAYSLQHTKPIYPKQFPWWNKGYIYIKLCAVWLSDCCKCLLVVVYMPWKTYFSGGFVCFFFFDCQFHDLNCSQVFLMCADVCRS